MKAAYQGKQTNIQIQIFSYYILPLLLCVNLSWQISKNRKNVRKNDNCFFFKLPSPSMHKLTQKKKRKPNRNNQNTAEVLINIQEVKHFEILY